MNAKVKELTIAIEERKPRSIRLNKEHRGDILSAVMKRWAEVNPAPTVDPFKDMIEAAVKKFSVVRRNRPEEQRAFARSLIKAENAITVYGHLSPVDKELIYMKTTSTFMLRITNKDGEVSNTYNFTIPAKWAKEVYLPVLSVNEQGYCGGSSYLREYGETNENGCHTCDTANIPSKQPLVIVMENTDNIYRAYKENTKAAVEWEKERTRQRDEVFDYLEQFNTTGQVREAWPELVQYLPAHIADPENVIKLPALTKSRLNERLGL